MSIDFATATQHIIRIGGLLYRAGWAPASSGNYSARLNDGTFAMTVSGAHKGQLTEEDVMRVDATGKSLDGRQASAETALHMGIYQRYAHVNAVLHTHSNDAVLLSRIYADNALEVVDYELLKALPTVDKHMLYTVFPLIDNSQDMDALAKQVDTRLGETTASYIIRNHGVYSWGNSLDQAFCAIEGTEHILSCVLRELSLKSGT